MLLLSCNPSIERSEYSNRELIYEESQSLIMDTLLSPASAVFPDFESSFVNDNEEEIVINNPNEHLFERLRVAARDPMAESKASGVAFEELIAEMFAYMGFEAKRIGGAGNTE